MLLRGFRRTLTGAAVAVGVAGLPATAGASTSVLACGFAGHMRAAAHPATCFLDWPNLPLAQAVTLHNMRWSGWGGPVATGVGRTRVKVNDPWLGLTARASRRVRCAEDGQLYYSRVRVTFANANAHTWRTPTCSQL